MRVARKSGATRKEVAAAISQLTEIRTAVLSGAEAGRELRKVLIDLKNGEI